MMGWILEDLVRVDQIYPISKFPFKIGRNAQANIICRDVKISKNHAVITTQNDRLFITDTSSNGVYINNCILDKHRPYEITHNDNIALGVLKEQMGSFKTNELFIFKLKVDQTPLLETPPTSSDAIEYAENNNQNNEVKQEIKQEVAEAKAVPQSVASTSKGEVRPLPKRKVELDSSLPFSEVSSNYFAGISQDVKGILETLNSQIPNATVPNQKNSDNAVKPAINKGASNKHNDNNELELKIIPENNEVIIIDDDDDMLLSQLYIKTEPGEQYDEDYLQIKQEVADMDKYDSEVLKSPILIDDDDSMESLGSAALLRLLETSIEERTKSPELLFDADEEQIFMVIDEGIAKGANESNERKDKESKDLKEISETIKSKWKQNKPEVIDALPLLSKSQKRRHEEPQEKKSKELPKTKDDGINSKSKKCLKTESLHEATKGKSTECVKTQSKPRSRTHSKEYDQAPVNIKTSKTNEKEKPPPMAMQRIPKKLTFASAEAFASTSKAAISAVAPCTFRIDPRVSHVSNHRVSPSTSSPVVPENYHTERPRLSSHQPQFWRMQSNESPKTAAVVLEHKSFILRMCTWQNSFFTQVDRMDITAIWSDVDGSILTKMPMIYNDFRYYQSAMQTVVMSDLFSDVYKEYHSTPFASRGVATRYRGSLGTRAVVTTVTQHSDHTELICYYYTGVKELGDQFIDCCFLNFIVSGGPNQEARTFFGVVGWTTSVKLREADEINESLRSQCKSYPWYKHTFSLLIKKTSGVQACNNIMCRNFGSIRRHLNRLCAIKRVEGSIAQQILSPNPIKFVIPEFSLPPPQHYLRMNSKQAEIVTQTMRFCTPRTDLRLFLIHGPPGTGKSDLAVNIVLNLLKNAEKRTAVLLLAQCNASVDTLMRRIDAVRKALPAKEKQAIKMVRLGQRCSISPDMLAFHVDDHVSRHLRQKLFDTSPHLKQTYRLLEEHIQTLTVNSNTNRDCDALLLKKQEELANFAKDHYLRQYKKEAARARDLVFEHATLICSTIGSSYTFPNNRIQLQFKCCIIDEATQAIEPDTLLPLTLGVQKFILVGDPEQLPPVNNLVPREYLFSQSLFSRLHKCLNGLSGQNAMYMLDEQYRMREEICSFPNRWFYNRRLITVPRPIREDIKSLLPYLVFELHEDHQKDSTYVNHQEIDTILSILSTIGQLKLATRLTVGIITPYNDQRLEFKKKLQGLRLNDKIKVIVQTIDGCQGQEQDIILLSLVLKLSNQFLNDAQRLNVALTRARSCLYVLGSSMLFNSGSLLRDLQIDARHRGVYIHVPKHVDSTTFRHHLIL